MFSRYHTVPVNCNKCDKTAHVSAPLTTPTLSKYESVVDSFVILSTSNVKSSVISPSSASAKQEEDCSYRRNTRLNMIAQTLLDHGLSDEDSDEEATLEETTAEIFSSPYCSSCVDELVQLLDEEIEQLQLESVIYDKKLNHLEHITKQSTTMNNEAHLLEEEDKYMQEMTRLMKQEQTLRESLSLLVSEKGKLASEYNKQLEKKEALEMRQIRYWKLFFTNVQAHEDFVEERNSMENALIHLESECKRLKSLSPETSFDIWYEGEFGTINNLKLGRLPECKVDWDEINAAWGLCCLLLHTLAKQKKFTFSMYRLIPAASVSKIEDIEDGKQYGLYYTSARHLALFNKAIKCFLACVNEFCISVENKNSATPHKSPLKRYPIEEDEARIGGLRVEYTMEDEASWTKALKHLLINLKYLQKN